MRYDKLGNPVLHKLGSQASFANVYLTAVELGFSIKSKGMATVILTETIGHDKFDCPIERQHWIEPEKMVEFLNQRMLDNGIIIEEPEP